jgi:hypothetical protein
MQDIEHLGLAVDLLDHGALGVELFVDLALAVELMADTHADAAGDRGGAAALLPINAGRRSGSSP